MSSRYHPAMVNYDSTAMEHAVSVHSHHPRPGCRLTRSSTHHPALSSFVPHRIKGPESIDSHSVICLSAILVHISFKAVTIKQWWIGMPCWEISFVSSKQAIFHNVALKIENYASKFILIQIICKTLS